MAENHTRRDSLLEVSCQNQNREKFSNIDVDEEEDIDDAKQNKI